MACLRGQIVFGLYRRHTVTRVAEPFFFYNSDTQGIR